MIILEGGSDKGLVQIVCRKEVQTAVQYRSLSNIITVEPFSNGGVVKASSAPVHNSFFKG